MNKVIVGVNKDLSISLGANTNHEIWCYGDIEWDSNFVLAFQDELYDGIIPGFDNEVKDWIEVVNKIKSDTDLDILQLEQIECV